MDTTPQPRKLGLAIASLVLGILSVGASFLLIGCLFGFVGLVLGIVHLRQKQNRSAMGWWGIGLSLFGVLVSIGFGVLYWQGYKHIRTAMESSSDRTALTEWEGVPAPDFTFTALDGKQIALSELKGKRVVLDFWATWCPPCRKEIPHFIQLANEASRDDLVVIGISTENEAPVRAFATKQGINYPVAAVAKPPAPYDGIQSIPTTLFIDRQGVIQNVLVGYHDFDALKTHALQKDYEGTPKSPPTAAVSELKEASHRFTATNIWSKTINRASALCAGDWQQNGQMKLLVADYQKRLHVLDAEGNEENSVPLPDDFTMIECGRHKDQNSRLLGYSIWGRKVVVMDCQGKELWTYTHMFGIDGAHWGDLDGDGIDELIVGMNGSGGLHAVSAAGKLLWKVSDIGNVWNQAVISARASHPALIFATEAGGSVRVYDSAGKLLHTLRPDGKYCAQMTATVVDAAGTVQAIAIGDAKTIAFDPTGTVAWSTSAIKNHGAWRKVSFASGDLTGDGQCKWAFLEGNGDLVVVTAQGEKLCAIPGQKGIEAIAIASSANKPGILVTLKSGVLQAYRLQPLSGESHATSP